MEYQLVERIFIYLRGCWCRCVEYLLIKNHVPDGLDLSRYWASETIGFLVVLISHEVAF